MTITHRRILYSAFFLMFFIAAPIILLITAGYRIDIPRRTIIKTSTIVVSLRETPDTILLDGKAIRSRGATVRFNALAPGVHTIRLEKGGHHPWEKAVSVEPGEAVSLADIYLIRRTEPQLIAQDVRSFAISPDQRTLAIIHNDPNALILYNIADGSDTQMTAKGLPSALTKAVWSPSGQHLLLRGEPDIWAVLSPFGQNPAARTLLLPKGTERAEWDPSKDGRVVALHGGKLLQYAIAEDTTVVLDRNVLDWQYHDGTLSTLQQTGGGLIAVISGADASEPLALLPGLTEPRFLPSPAKIITILDAQQQVLTLLDADHPANRSVAYQRVTFADWGSDGSDLVFGNAMELNTARKPLQEATTQTITRGSSGFWGAQWLQNTQYVLANQSLAMKVFETALGSPYQSFTAFAAPQRQIAQFGNDSVLIVDANGSLFSLQVF